MLGSYNIKVKNRHNEYDFTLNRNITIVRGNSGTGKTTLYDLVYEYNRYGTSSGIKLVCNVNVITLSGNDWLYQLKHISNSIILVDEDNDFIQTKEFAKEVNKGTNYFLIFTRIDLKQLAYSINEIYEIKGRKKKKFVPVYKENHYLYHDVSNNRLPYKPDIIITEDSNSGYYVFNAIAKKYNLKCISAKGKSNIVNTLVDYENDNVVVIADASAIGCEIENLVLKQSYNMNQIILCLPESFEYLILKSGVVACNQQTLDHPIEYVDYTQHISYERYYCKLLQKLTKDYPYMKYTKKTKNKFYLEDKNLDKICDELSNLTLKNK